MSAPGDDREDRGDASGDASGSRDDRGDGAAAGGAAPGAGRPDCPHVVRVEGVCQACGHCEHALILNLECFHCGATDLDPVALSNKPVAPALIPPDRLRRR